MKFILDTDKLNETDISIEELTYLLALYLGGKPSEDSILKLHHKGYVIQNESTHVPRYSITPDGETKVEEFFMSSEFGGSEVKKERFEILAEKLRELFPKGRKPGTNYQWRDSNRIIALRLKSLVKKFNVDFTDEEAVDATKRYIESFNGNYQYMQLLKYFICKPRIIDGEVEQSSQLLSYIENKEEGDMNNDWTAEIR